MEGKKKKGKKKKAARKAAKAKSTEMKAKAKPEEPKEKKAENRSTLIEGKRLTLGGVVLEAIEEFNKAHREEFNRPITRRELAASIKIARDALIEKKVFKKYERKKKTYTAPDTPLGQNLTIEVIAGNDKGKTVKGIYIDWKESNGCAKVYGSIGTDNPKNHWGRPIIATAEPQENDDSSEKKAAS